MDISQLVVRVEDSGAPMPHRSPPVDILTDWGRRYFMWKGRVYPFPIDKSAFETLDFLGDLIIDAMQKVHEAELPDTDSHDVRILDLGYGTGHWVRSAAHYNPEATVIGVDLKGYKPEGYRETFPNLTLLCPVDFTEDDWGVASASFDLIRVSLLSGSVADWNDFFRRVRRYLKPGVGQVEIVEIDWMPRSYGSEQDFPVQDMPLKRFHEDVERASAIAGFPMAYRHDMGNVLRMAGLCSPVERTIPLPLRGNPNDWRDWDLAEQLRAAMGTDGGLAYMGMSMFFLNQFLYYSPEKVSDMCRQATRVLLTSGPPVYYNLHVWTARRPQARQ